MDSQFLRRRPELTSEEITALEARYDAAKDGDMIPVTEVERRHLMRHGLSSTWLECGRPDVLEYVPPRSWDELYPQTKVVNEANLLALL